MSQEVIEELAKVVIRFAGDSGDGMQLTGTQFTNTSALVGNNLATLPDFPAEIRAPQGTLAGVSGFQIQLGETEVYTPGDESDVLVAMNPAALKANLHTLRIGGTLVLNRDSLSDISLKKAGYSQSPLEDNSLKDYDLLVLPITEMNRDALKDIDGLDARSKDRCRNFFTLGLMYWMYSRPLENTENWIEQKFSKKPAIALANKTALHAGYNCGGNMESIGRFAIKSATITPGTYRNITGNEALTLGLLAASEKSDRQIILGSYPITPASDILHLLANAKEFGVVTFQAEDEIAAVCSAIGASYGGAIGVTSTSGPGLCLKAEAIGLAVKTELPLIVIDVQRSGPSTGMPTKTEQSDLLLATFGRNGDSPICILAPATPSDCFQMAFEAMRISLKYMTPVFILSDGYLANGAEPWLLPDLGALPRLENCLIDPDKHQDEAFLPYKRNENMARAWSIPGQAGFEHRLSGLETHTETGNISYLPENHQEMTRLRFAKIDKIADDIPPLEVEGDKDSDVLILGWGSTYGFIKSAREELSQEGVSVAQAHLRYLNPFPSNIAKTLSSYKHILIPENNAGQLSMLIRSKYLLNAHSLSKVAGQPFKVREIKEAVRKML